MNHNEEMKLLGYLKKIADNTGRIADALEKMVPPVLSEVKPVMKDAEDSKSRDDASLGIVKICCETCQFVHAPNHDRIACVTCRNFDNWEPREAKK